MAQETRESLYEAFFTHVPKARKGSGWYNSQFELMYDAHLLAKPGTKLLNIYSSKDFSGNREEIFKERFFNQAEYHAVDYWEDKFIVEGQAAGAEHTLPYPDGMFDVIVTTKVIMEHITEPQRAVNEFLRVLKPGGQALVIAPLVRRQHQKPYDFFRYTEFALEYLFKKAGFTEIDLRPSNGAMETLTTYSYFMQRGWGAPKWIEKFFDWIYYWIMEPLGFALDKLDKKGYGRDLTLYFMVRAKK